MEKNTTVASTIPFRDVCNLLDKISNLGTGKAKAEKLSKFCDRFRKVYQNRYKTMDPSEANGDSLFCIIRLLFPLEDRSRPPYGFKAVKLAGQFPKILGLDPESVDGKKFINFKDPKQAGSAAGDLSQLVYHYLESRSSYVSGEPLNLAELHSILDRIAALFGASSAAAGNENAGAATDFSIINKQRPIMQSLFRRVTPMEGKWLTRILLRRHDLGMQNGAIFNCIHPKAQELYSRIGNLEAVCIELNDPKAEMEESKIELFRPFDNMLCARITSLKDSSDAEVPSYFKNLTEKNKKEGLGLPSPPFYIEIKFDGERFLIHYDSTREPDDQFRYFSRSRREYSKEYMSISLTLKIRAQIHPKCTSFILDGEMMVWSSETKNFIQKALSPHLREKQADHPDLSFVFVAFDLIFYNGENLESVPLQRRMQILMKDRLVFQPQEGVILLSEQQLIQCNARELVTQALNKAVDGCEEGLVLKDWQSKYEIGKRSGAWRKIKPEFFAENSINDLDLLILGGYWSKSQVRGGKISSFLVGLLDDDPSSTRVAKEQFYSITTVGPGHLKIPELFQLVKELEPNFIPKEKNPKFCDIRYDSRPKPHFFIDPNKSVVLQVKASQIIVGDAPKYSLNFPRITMVRRDKTWRDIMTFREFEELLQANVGGRLVKRNDIHSPRGFQQKRQEEEKPSAINFSGTPSKTNYNKGGWGKRKQKSPEEKPVSKKFAPVVPSSSAAAVATPPKSVSSRSFTIPTGSYKSKFNTKSTVAPLVTSSSTASSSKFKLVKNKWPARNVVKAENKILDNRVFLVLGSTEFKSRVTAEILKNGGKIVQNPTKDLFAILAEKVTMRVSKFIGDKSHPVLKYSWLQKSIQSGSFETILSEDCWRPEDDNDFSSEEDDRSASPSLFQSSYHGTENEQSSSHGTEHEHWKMEDASVISSDDDDEEEEIVLASSHAGQPPPSNIDESDDDDGGSSLSLLSSAGTFMMDDNDDE